VLPWADITCKGLRENPPLIRGFKLPRVVIERQGLEAKMRSGCSCGVSNRAISISPRFRRVRK
jgi:hypothetical protein